MIEIKFTIQQLRKQEYCILPSVWHDAMVTDEEAKIAMELSSVLNKAMLSYRKHLSDEGFNLNDTKN